jgi:hypothetical protein
MLNLSPFPSTLLAQFRLQPCYQKSAAAPPFPRLSPLKSRAVSPAQPKEHQAGPTALSPPPFARGRRQVGATCHPPPSVAPSRNRPELGLAPHAALLALGPHAKAPLGLFKAQTCAAPP